MRTKGIFVIALLVVMVSAASAASVDLVHKDTNWNVLDTASTLEYTMPCPGSEMTYTYTLNQSLDSNTEYCLLFYIRNAETVSWLNADNEVWGNQSSKIINCSTTNDTGWFTTDMTGTFNFSLYGTGLDYIKDGDDYDGSVEGAKVWLVPNSSITSGAVDAVTGWNPTNFLFETELVSCTGGSTQTIAVVVDCPVSFEVSPTTYDYGTISPGACSGTSPDGQITLNNTGCPAVQVSVVTTGIFENIDYYDGTSWVDANVFSTIVNAGVSKKIHTKICIPSGTVPGSYPGTVTFEYIAIQ